MSIKSLQGRRCDWCRGDEYRTAGMFGERRIDFREWLYLKAFGFGINIITL